MAWIRKARTKSGEYTRSYHNIRGVELGGTGSAISHSRLVMAENMYRDYEGEGGELIESVPGYREVANFGETIDNLTLQKGERCDFIVLRANKKLYRFAVEERDGIANPAPITELSGEGYTAFNFGTSLFVIDGVGLTEITSGGEVKKSGEDYIPYIPTTYLNGEKFEQKNLISNKFREEYLIADASGYTYGSPELRYIILDSVLKTCAVSGIKTPFTGVLYVPAVTKIGGVEYRVIEILDYALSRISNVTEIYIAEGVERVGRFLLAYDFQLTKVVIPSSVVELANGLAEGCLRFTELYLGAGLKRIGGEPAVGTSSLTEIHYAGNSDMLAAIDGAEWLESFEIIYDDEDKTAAFELPVHEDCAEVTSLSENGEEIEYTEVITNGKVTSLIFESQSAQRGESRFIISGNMPEYKSRFGGAGDEISGDAAIYGCRVAEAFDGRIFLAGNPSLPNTIFYSARGKSTEDIPLYFGAFNYFVDGIGGYPTSSMLAVRDSLAVFKSGDDGTGSIFYHTPTDTDDDYIPKIYPVGYIHSGIGAVGGSISFFDDPIFLTKSGVYALTKKAINYERSIACRSHNVNAELLTSDLSGVVFTEWLGYLVVGAGERAYLADSRATFTEDGNTEYEWFTMRGLGFYTNDVPLYRYDSYENADISSHASPGSIANGVVMSRNDENGNTYFYVEEDGKKYGVYPSGERVGGVFHPAKVYLGVGDLLFFGCEGGALCVFNNDKRGVPPDTLREKEDFDEEEYRAHMGRSIHPEFYSFANHAPTYAIKTAKDDCNMPHLTKSTVKHSLVAKYKTYTFGEIHCEVGTDNGGYSEIANFPASALCFDEINFESLVMAPGDYHTVPIAEKEKGWIEKQITVRSSRYASPIGLYSITYRYMIKGRIKKQ